MTLPATATEVTDEPTALPATTAEMTDEQTALPATTTETTHEPPVLPATATETTDEQSALPATARETDGEQAALPATTTETTDEQIASPATVTEITPEQIVEKADHIRFPTEGFQVDVEITTTKPEQDPEIKAYRILSKGNDRTLLMTTAPAVDKGTILLMRDRDLWAFLPNLSQPVRLPLSAKLTGEVSNGDIARANFTGDYDATLLGVDMIEEQAHYKLELKAARKGVTYNRVLYWVSQADFRPFKSEFYSVSGRLIKTCHYQVFREMAGAVRPTQLVMVDGVTRQGRSVLDYTNMKLRNLPDKVFTKQYLKKLSK